MAVDMQDRVASRGGPPPVRLLSIPGRQHENKFFGHLLGAMEQRGLVIVPPRLKPLALFRYDVLHLNFPSHHISESGFGRAFLLSMLLGGYLLVARLLRRAVIYTVHDVVPLRPRHGLLLRGFLGFLHRVVSALVFLSPSSRRLFTQAYPHAARKRWTFAPHGPYDVTRLGASDRAARRQRLVGGRAAFIVGFVGAIKPYKSIEALQHLPERLPDGRDVHVVVAGRVEAGYEALAEQVLGTIPAERLTRIEGRLSDEDLDHLIQTVDLVLLPYRRGSNSGAAVLVLSNHGRLAGSELGIFQELGAQPGAPWAYALNPDDPAAATYADLVRRAAEEEPAYADHERLSRYLASTGWGVAAEAIGLLIEQISERTASAKTSPEPNQPNVSLGSRAHPGYLRPPTLKPANDR